VQEYVKDPVKANIIVPRGSNWDDRFPISNTVTWNDDWASALNDSYLEIDFMKHKICPTHYSMRGTKQEWCYQQQWDLYGYNDARAKNDTWMKLSTNKGNENTFCGNGTDCTNHGTSTFEIDNRNPGCFRFLRFITTASSCPTFHFTTSGVDFYGMMMKIRRNSANAQLTAQIAAMRLCFYLISFSLSFN
jgi:hypothetical protein